MALNVSEKEMTTTQEPYFNLFTQCGKLAKITDIWQQYYS